MDSLFNTILIAAGAMSPWEVLAVVLSVAYLVLATKEHIACWYCALASTAIFSILFWDVSLLMDSALNVYYMAMAVYGWRQWRYGGRDHDGAVIRTLSPMQHTVILVSIALLTGISGYLLSENTQAAWPFVDSFTTWASVITTVMVAHKVLENWLYWFVIDAVSIPLYIERGLHLTALLFVVYLGIVVVGFMTWQKRRTQQSANPAHA